MAAQVDQDCHCPFPESLHTKEYTVEHDIPGQTVECAD